MVAGVDQKNERPSLFNLAVPSILANLTYSLIVMVQTYFVGELGSEAIAAVGIGQRVFFAIQALLMAVSAGTTALVARAWGANDRLEACRVTVASLYIAGFIGVACGIPTIIFSYELAGIFGLGEVAQQWAGDNIRWMAVFNLGFALSFILSASLRAAGDAWTPLWLSLGMNVINIPLLYVLVPGNLGFPALEVKGAAIAGGVSGLLVSILGLILWFRQKFVIKYTPRNWFSWARIRRLIDIGFPAGIEMLIFQAGYFAFLMLLGQNYGDIAVAAYSLGGSIFMVAMVVGFGFSIAGSTLSGQHLGADDPEGATKSGWKALAYAILSMGSIVLVIAFFASPIAKFFVDDNPQTIIYVSQIAWIAVVATPFMAIEFAIGGALRGAGDTRFPLIATVVGLIGIRVGVAVAAVLLSLPVFWLFASTAIEYSVKGAMLIWRFQSGKWKNLHVFTKNQSDLPKVA